VEFLKLRLRLMNLCTFPDPIVHHKLFYPDFICRVRNAVASMNNDEGVRVVFHAEKKQMNSSLGITQRKGSVRSRQ